MEGNGALRLLQLMKDKQSQGTTISLATVMKVNPLAIRIDGDSMDTPEQALIVAETLTAHRREWRLVGGTYQTYEIKSPLSVGNRVIVAVASDGQLIYVLDKAVI